MDQSANDSSFRGPDFWQRSDVHQAFLDFTDSRVKKFDKLSDTIRSRTGRFHTVTVLKREYGAWLTRNATIRTLEGAKPPRIVGGRAPTLTQASSSNPRRSLMNVRGGTLTVTAKRTYCSISKKFADSTATVELNTSLHKKRQAKVLRSSETFIEGSEADVPPPRKYARQPSVVAEHAHDGDQTIDHDDDNQVHEHRLSEMPESFAPVEAADDGSTVTMACQFAPEQRTLGTQTAQFTSPYALPERETNVAQYARYRAEQEQVPAVQYDGVFQADQVGAEYVQDVDYELYDHMQRDVQEEETILNDDQGAEQVTHSTSGQSWMAHSAGAMGEVRKPEIYLESFGGVTMQNQRPLLYERVNDDDYRPVFRKQNGGNRATGVPAENEREGFAYYECIGCNTVVTAMRRQCRQLFKCERTRVSRNRIEVHHQITCPCIGDPAPRRYKYHEPSSTVMWTHNEHIATCQQNTRADLVKQQVSRVMTKYVRENGYEPQIAYDTAMHDGEQIARQFNVSWQVLAPTMGRYDDHRRRLRTAQLRASQTKGEMVDEDEMDQHSEYAELIGADGEPMVDAESGQPLRVYAPHLVATDNVIYDDGALHVFEEETVEDEQYAHEDVVIE